MKSKKQEFRGNTLELALIQQIKPISICQFLQQYARNYTIMTSPYTLMSCKGVPGR